MVRTDGHTSRFARGKTAHRASRPSASGITSISGEDSPVPPKNGKGTGLSQTSGSGRHPPPVLSEDQREAQACSGLVVHLVVAALASGGMPSRSRHRSRVQHHNM